MIHSGLYILRKAIDDLMLADLVRKKDQASLNAALNGLGALGPAAKSAAPIIGAAKDLEGTLRVRANYALARMAVSPAHQQLAVKALIEALDSEERGVALWSLQRIGPAARDAVPVLRKGLAEDANDRHAVALALVAIQGIEKAPDAWAFLIEALEAQNPYVAGQLGDLGPAAKPAVPLLLAMLADGNDRARLAAVQSLGKIAIEDAEVRRAITEVRRSDSWAYVLIWAANVLGG